MMETFWIERGKWPQEAFGYVFLGQAVVDVGKAMFGEEWTGYEGSTTEPDLLPADFTLPDGRQVKTPQAMATDRHKSTVGHALAKHRGWSKPLGPPSRWQFTPEEWADGLDLARTDNGVRSAKLARFWAVQSAIAKAALAGELVIALRPVQGGVIGAALPVHLWNTERVRPRFNCCQMDPGEPFGAAVTGSRHQYIFVSRPSLDTFIAKVTGTAMAAKGKDFAGFAPYFKGEVEAHPDKISITNKSLFTIGRTRFGLSKGDVEIERRSILEKMPSEVRSVWTAGNK